MRKGVTDDKAVAADILDRAEVIWLALNDSEGPHCVPVNFAREGDTLYVHSGRKGRKAACLDSGAPLAFSAAVDMRLKTSDENACELGYRFRSVMGGGAPRALDGEDKLRALDRITLKYAGRAMPYNEKVLAVTAAYAIDITSVTARIKD
ncbi:pyridoxamine 5'-phosphate oxidase-related FMN-binding protein [Pseudodesulfovibrio mercurii]|uniref:Pyridoxamine 5'-phosphate oxidase-related FMN-binding protein n=1 Tax=Pseudodesulfovibrio mercurii TaxID=641491 RepID=F0JKI0_9BACT|nr:pyridoxamine 5'-phosphate oxidase family protein [Pseudodesulfovibrio mercurii]EGB16429.1 pyridoxamine 5'-phosphate oxidase-related FMN-binding protein [Pseudodesulfovibrio mercurii]